MGQQAKSKTKETHDICQKLKIYYRGKTGNVKHAVCKRMYSHNEERQNISLKLGVLQKSASNLYFL